MGVDDEYRAVSTAEDSNDAFLEKSGAPMTRSAYKKRSVAASVIIGALIGAAAMFFVVAVLGVGSNSKTVAAPPAATVTKTIEAPGAQIAAPTTIPVAADTHTKSKPNPADDKIEDCGGNPAEARAKGCVFDVMMQLWMPPACYDEKLSERYLLSGNWTWWVDAEASAVLTLDEMRKGEHPVIYVIQDYHKQHCIFAWEKVIRALRTGQPVIEELISYDHVMHCKHTTLSKESENVRGVRAPTAYARCAKYDVWTRHMPANTMSSTD